MDALLHFPAAAVGGDVGEREPGVHHYAAELGGVCVEVVMSTKRAGWWNKVANHSKKASLIARNQQLSFTFFTVYEHHSY